MQKVANNYAKILESVVRQIEQSKLKAFSEVNKALLQAYWNIGKELSKTSEYGKAVVERLSRDLRLRFPGIRGYSVRNLWNMKKFYETYSKMQMPSAELLESQKLQPLVAELPTNRKLQPVVRELPTCQKLESVTLELLFGISWVNHLLLLNKTSSLEEKEFYLKMSIRERWSKRELDRQIDSSLFERYMAADKPEKHILH